MEKPTKVKFDNKKGEEDFKGKSKAKPKLTLVEKMANAKMKLAERQAVASRKIVMHEILCPKCQGLKIKDQKAFDLYEKRIKDEGGKV